MTFGASCFGVVATTFSYGLNLPQMMPRLGTMVTGTVLAGQEGDLMAQIRQMQSGFQKMYASRRYPLLRPSMAGALGEG